MMFCFSIKLMDVMCVMALWITEINLGHLGLSVCQVSPIKGKTTEEGCIQAQ